MRDHDHDSAAALHILGIAIGLACFLAALYSAGCAPMPGPDPRDAGATDAGPCSDGVHDACDLAAQHLCDLGCDVRGSSGIDRVWGTADDDTWAEACRVISFSTTCIASATTCEQAEACQ